MARYLAGECSDEEEQEIEAWLNEASDRQTLLENLREIWTAGVEEAGEEDKDLWDVEASLKRLENKMDLDGDESRVSSAAISSRRRALRNRNSMQWMMRAAVILVLATGLAVVFNMLQTGEWLSPADPMAMHEVVTGTGERATVMLDDGSRVRLNVESRVMIPEEFGENTRTVHVEGEAFFEVFPDDRPFIVKADRAVAEVLGTQFNLCSYTSESHIRLVVAEGKVRFQPLGGPEGDTAAGVTLESGDMGTLSRDRVDEITTVHNVEVGNFTGWMDNRLIFDHTPLDNVARTLNRWYGVDIEFSERELEQMRFSATFEDEPLYEVLQVMAMSLDLEYETVNRTVVFSPSP